jgi:hypothetical protein
VRERINLKLKMIGGEESGLTRSPFIVCGEDKTRGRPEKWRECNGSITEKQETMRID